MDAIAAALRTDLDWLRRHRGSRYRFLTEGDAIRGLNRECRLARAAQREAWLNQDRERARARLLQHQPQEEEHHE